MNLSKERAIVLIQELVTDMPEVHPGHGVIIFPPFPFLSVVGSGLSSHKNYFLGAQNCHASESGAFTGEVSVPMLQSIGVTHVLVGHSERRRFFGETDFSCREKISIILKHRMVPVFCCGETGEEREKGMCREVVIRQIRTAFEGLVPDSGSKFMVAYEPVWAIGTGKNATAAQASEMHAVIRAELSAMAGATVAEEVSILYGGSCNASNAAEIFSKPHVDGGLIGGASLKADEFLKIIGALKG